MSRIVKFFNFSYSLLDSIKDEIKLVVSGYCQLSSMFYIIIRTQIRLYEFILYELK